MKKHWILLIRALVMVKVKGVPDASLFPIRSLLFWYPSSNQPKSPTVLYPSIQVLTRLDLKVNGVFPGWFYDLPIHNNGKIRLPILIWSVIGQRYAFPVLDDHQRNNPQKSV